MQAVKYFTMQQRHDAADSCFCVSGTQMTVLKGGTQNKQPCSWTLVAHRAAAGVAFRKLKVKKG